MPKRYLIIGDGAAGTTAAQYLRGADPSAAITIYSDDPNAAYYRAALTKYLLGELREDQIWAVPQTFYEEFRINRLLARVTQVDTRGSQLFLSHGGRPEPYDALVIGAGSRARQPTFQGADLPGVMVMRTLADVRKVVDLIKLRGLKQAVVVGGGPLALEWAHGLTHRGVKVTLMVRESRFLPGAIDAVASDLLLARLRHGGVDVRAGDEVTAAISGSEGRVAGVVTKAGARIPCELVACGIGVICNSEFLQNSGIALEKNGGIIVDERMRTSIPNVYAAGDIASVRGKLLQLWEPARHQARVAAQQITGSKDEVYNPGVHYMATRLYDLDVASVGLVSGASPEAQGAEEVIDFPQRTGHISYRKLSIRHGKLIGALVFGQREARVRKWGRQFKQLIDEQIDVSQIKRDLQDPMFDLSAWMQKNELLSKPSQSPATLQSPAEAASSANATPKGQKFKRTAAINLADLPPLPVAGMAGMAGMTGNGTQMTPATAPQGSPASPSPAAPLKRAGTQALGAFLDPKDLPRVFLDGPRGRFELTASVAILGSDPQCAVPIQDANVSYTHAQISRTGAAVYVRYLGTPGGTWVNGAATVMPTKLRDGDKIRLGGTEIVVHLEARPGGAPLSMMPPAPPPPPPVPRGTMQSAAVPSMPAPMPRPSIPTPPPMLRPSVPPSPPMLRPSGPPPSAFASPPRGRITLRHPQGQSQLPELSEHTVFGSQQGSCHFVVPDPAVFPVHLEIVRRPDGFWARALDPRIGTSWRGQMIGPQPVKLANGDVLMLGPRVALFFEGTA